MEQASRKEEDIFRFLAVFVMLRSLVFTQQKHFLIQSQFAMNVLIKLSWCIKLARGLDYKAWWIFAKAHEIS